MLLLGFHYSSFLRIDIAIAIAIDILFTLIIQNQSPLPIPKPAERQVLVKVRAFGLNRSELMTRKGLFPSVRFPRILGIECVGEVEHDPSGEYDKGQQVMAFMGEMGRGYDGS
jgi:NADPH:quinone reductase-like Zn-dependent oxidoreductase